ncbi:MAG: glycosyltransferase, partial [Acidobacteriaceae bacterium]|nr:glycosyltransferase [Acidobacteriaceae bacterium]
MLVHALACVSLLIWLYLVLARGGFWRVRRLLRAVDLSKAQGKRISVVIPARDEADVIGPSIASLLRHEHVSAVQIFLVDDSSSDGTADVAEAAAREAGLSEKLT